MVAASEPYGGSGGSARACPVCGRHALALERPPEIQVVGAQPYTELYRMGDLPMPVGVRCRACGAWWPTIEALEAGEPPSTEDAEPADDVGDPELEPEPAEVEDDRAPVPSTEPGPAQDRSSLGAIAVMVAAFAVGIVLLYLGLLVPAFIVVGAAALVARFLHQRR